MSRANNVPWMRIAAEGTAVVVSILLAFAIDAWWDDHNELLRERQILSTLLVELEQNRQVIDEATVIYEKSYRGALGIIDAIDAPPESVNADALVPLFRDVLTGRTFHLESATYDGLIAAGELDLVRDDDLRATLAAWPSYVDEWTEEVENVFLRIRDDLKPYLSDKVRLRGIGLNLAPYPHGEEPPSFPESPTGAGLSVELIRSAGLENLIVLQVEALWYAMRDGEILDDRLSEIEQGIRAYLAQ